MAATLIGAHARITGTIDLMGEIDGDAVHGALDLVVSGRVDGSIRARGVIHLKPTAEVHGDLEAARVIIDDGAIFEGQVRLLRAQARVEAPRVEAPRVEAPRVEPTRAEPARSEPTRSQPTHRVVPELSSPGRRRLQRRTT